MKMRELLWDDVYTAAGILENLKVDLKGINIDRDSGYVAGLSIFKNMIAHAGDARVEKIGRAHV